MSEAKRSDHVSGGILVLEISVSKNIKHSSPYARLYLKMQELQCVLAYLQKRRESRGSEKETPDGSRRSFRRGRKEAEVFKKPPVGRPRDLEMAPEGVWKRKRQNRDFYNTSKLISPFLMWEGPWK